MVTLWERLGRVHEDVSDHTLSISLAALHVALAKTRTRLPSFRAELARARRALDDDDFMAALAPQDRWHGRVHLDALRAGLDLPP